MRTELGSSRYWQAPIFIAFLFALLKILIYIVAGANYGYFRDELYFLACADNLAWGYPDHAPLSVFLTWASRAVIGDSLYAIHLLPTLAGALKIVMTGLIVREFGGRHMATLLACLCVLVAPVYLGIDLLLSMNAYEPVLWMGCVLCYIWAVKRGDPRYWLLFGAFAGLGLMNKHSMLFFGLAFVIGLVLTQDRKVFRGVHVWLGAVIAFVLFLPNLIWQVSNDLPTLELLRNVQETGKNVVLAPHEFLWQQVFILLPLTAPVWIAGLWWLLADRSGKRFRTLGIAYIAVLVLMIVLKAKNYYLVPVYPMLFAAGGVFWERLFSRFGLVRTAGIAYAALLAFAGIVFLPAAVPILPVEKFVQYQETLGIAPPKTEVGHSGPLPQLYGDRFGWEEMTEKVAEVFNSLPADERERAAIFTSNYGQAGAIDHFGAKYGLPKAISGHQSYYMWGPRGFDGSTMIVLGFSAERARRFCGSVEEHDRVEHPYSMGEERYNILVCRDLKKPLAQLWPDMKFWN